jgi:glycosyltransferase involved in cell wall biosynthesis
LLFAPDDSQGLAQKLANLAADEGLLQKLQENGRKTVVEDFTLSKMMDAYEYYLQKVADKHVSGEILQG